MGVGDEGLPRRQRKKPDFFSVGKNALQMLASKFGKPTQDVPDSEVADDATLAHAVSPPEVLPPSAPKRGRGRPRKVKQSIPAEPAEPPQPSASAASRESGEPAGQQPPKKKRARFVQQATPTEPAPPPAGSVPTLGSPPERPGSAHVPAVLPVQLVFKSGGLPVDAPRQCLELPAACSMPSLVAPAASSFQPAVPGPVGLGKAAAGQKRRGRKAQLAPPQSKRRSPALSKGGSFSAPGHLPTAAGATPVLEALQGPDQSTAAPQPPSSSSAPALLSLAAFPLYPQPSGSVREQLHPPSLLTHPPGVPLGQPATTTVPPPTADASTPGLASEPDQAQESSAAALPPQPEPQPQPAAAAANSSPGPAHLRQSPQAASAPINAATSPAGNREAPAGAASQSAPQGSTGHAEPDASPTPAAGVGVSSGPSTSPRSSHIDPPQQISPTPLDRSATPEQGPAASAPEPSISPQQPASGPTQSMDTLSPGAGLARVVGASLLPEQAKFQAQPGHPSPGPLHTFPHHMQPGSSEEPVQPQPAEPSLVPGDGARAVTPTQQAATPVAGQPPPQTQLAMLGLDSKLAVSAASPDAARAFPIAPALSPPCASPAAKPLAASPAEQACRLEADHAHGAADESTAQEQKSSLAEQAASPPAASALPIASPSPTNALSSGTADPHTQEAAAAAVAAAVAAPSSNQEPLAAQQLSPPAAKPPARISAASAVLDKAFRIREPRISALALPPALLSPAGTLDKTASSAAALSAEEQAELLLKRSKEEEERRAACEQLDVQMVALKRTRPSMAACTATALTAAHQGGAGQVVRQVMDAMQGSRDSSRRVDLLYLLDSLVQTSQRQSADKSGPADPLAARLFRDTISAALKRVAQTMCQDLPGCEKVLKVLKIWADRDLLFGPGLQDAQAAALKRQEALLAAKAEEAARRAAAAQAAKRAAEAKLNPRSKAPRLGHSIAEDQYGSAGAGRKSLDFGLQRKQLADEASDEEDDDDGDDDDDEDLVEEVHLAPAPAPGGGQGVAGSQSTSQGAPPGLASSPLDQMGPDFGDDFDEIYSNGLDHSEAPAFAGHDDRLPLPQPQRQLSSVLPRALPRTTVSHTPSRSSGSAGLPPPPSTRPGMTPAPRSSSAAAALLPVGTSSAPAPIALPQRSLPGSAASPAPWLAHQVRDSRAGSLKWNAGSASGGWPASVVHPSDGIEGGLSFGPSWDTPGAQHAGYGGSMPPSAARTLSGSARLSVGLPPAGNAWPGQPGMGPAAAAPLPSQHLGQGFSQAGSMGGAHSHLPPLPPEDDANDPAPPLPMQEQHPPLPQEDDPPPLPPDPLHTYHQYPGYFHQGYY